MYGQQVDIHSYILVDLSQGMVKQLRGIALDEEAGLAWKSTGEVCEAVSSRLVTARL